MSDMVGIFFQVLPYADCWHKTCLSAFSFSQNAHLLEFFMHSANSVLQNQSSIRQFQYISYIFKCNHAS
jgi:hypothetical protein